jgi:predicted RNA-binding protein YlxR (DUF448 family)
VRRTVKMRAVAAVAAGVRTDGKTSASKRAGCTDMHNNPVGRTPAGESKKRKGRRRAVPQRTCVGCRAVNPKRELVRIVRTPDGTVEIDPSGKLSGRGAYLHRQRGCWEQALKRSAIERALKTTLDEATREKLLAYVATLPANDEPSPDAEEG